MKISKVRIKQRAVVIEYENEGETHSVTSRDVPLPSFYEAVAALTPLVGEILHLPAEYLEGVQSTGLTIVDKQDVQLVVIVARKDLCDAHSPFNINTPQRFLHHPEEEGSYSPALGEKQVALVDAVIKEAKAYVKGERAQGQLPLETEEDDSLDDDLNTDEGAENPPLEFTPVTTGEGTPVPMPAKRGKKS